MNDFDKMTVSIVKLLPNKGWTIRFDENDQVNESMFNSIQWEETNNLTWTKVKEEMDKL